MLIKATRAFSNSVYGNISEGQVFNCDEARAKNFVENGLAVACAIATRSSSLGQEVNFQQAVVEIPSKKNSVSSQAETASQPKTVSLSKSGEVTYRRPRRK